MGLRQDLHLLLETFTPNVYFQPPTNIKMVYPCILYNRDFSHTEFADGEPYRNTLRYAVTVIDRDPDSVIPEKIAAMPMCVFNRHFTADGLNHDVYNVYF